MTLATRFMVAGEDGSCPSRCLGCVGRVRGLVEGGVGRVTRVGGDMETKMSHIPYLSISARNISNSASGMGTVFAGVAYVPASTSFLYPL